MHCFDAREPRLERFDTRDVFVHAMTWINSTQWSIGEIPFPGVEAKALINHQGLITAVLHEKDRLSAIGIACPLVVYQHAREVREVSHLAQFLVWQEILNSEARWIPRKTRAKLLPRQTTGSAYPQLDHQIGREFDQLPAHFHDFCPRHWKSHTRRQARTEHFVRQNSQMLGVVLELHHVVATVIAAHQVSLCAAAHTADLLNGEDH